MYYKELEEHHKTIRLIRHDLKNQLLTVNDESVEINELLEILEQAPARLTENIGLNQLIITKMQLAQETGITCDFRVQVPETMEFQQMDIGALVGNIMDNAIEACQRCPADRVFEMKLIYQGHALMIQSTNSTDGDVDITKTKKSNRIAHGLGMWSIKRIVEKYDGTVTWEILDGKFKVDVLIWEPKC